MKYFFLDTSNSRLLLAIYKNKNCLAYYNEPCDNNLSANIMPIIDKIFTETKTSPWDIDKIFVVNGPGSFTGVRIGVTIAKTYAWAFGIDIIPISGLEVLASSKFRSDIVVPLIDARRNNVYAGMYDKNLNKLREDCYINLGDLQEQSSGKKYIFTSYDKFENIDKIMIPKVRIWNVLKKHLNDEPTNQHHLNPNYLKLTEAEEKLKNDKNINVR